MASSKQKLGLRTKETKGTEILTRLKNDENLREVFGSFIISREQRNAVVEARKRLAFVHPDEYLGLVKERLAKRDIPQEQVDTILLSVRKSIRK